MTTCREFMLDRPERLDDASRAAQTGPVPGDELWTEADPLGAALHLLRMSGTYYFRSELTAPWGLDIPPMPDCLWFHVVTTGSARLEVDHAGAAGRCGRASWPWSRTGPGTG